MNGGKLVRRRNRDVKVIIGERSGGESAEILSLKKVSRLYLPYSPIYCLWNILPKVFGLYALQTTPLNFLVKKIG